MYLKYDSTRFLLILVVLVPVLLFVVPTLWPPPGAEAEAPATIVGGEDFRVRLHVRSWHENYAVRRIRVTINDVTSPAYLGREILLPFTLYRVDRIENWQVGLLDRVTFPRKISMDVIAPFGELFREGRISYGTLRGTVDVDIDHTKVRFEAGYPPLTFSASIPFEVTVVR